MFVAWAILHGLVGELHVEDSPELLEQLQQHTITPGQFLMQACDGKFTDEDLSDQGNAFAKHYFNSGDQWGAYLGDYEATLGVDGRSLYYVDDNWENYDRLAPVIQHRYDEWCKQA